MKYPDRRRAEELLAWAAEQNPGPWLQHSRNAACAAEAIARRCGMDGDRAYVLRLLHDIGRYEGVRGLHHAIAGHDLLQARGYGGAARICLNHSFPVPDRATFNGKQDCTPEETAFLDRSLTGMQYDDYDRLIQLCDALATAEGITMIEARLIDVAIRNGVGERYREKWRKFLELKSYFDGKCGCNLYSLFCKDIEKNIFG